MKTHVIFDFSYLYYKYYFMLKYGKMRRLTTNKEGGVEKDISMHYYCSKEIEKARKDMEMLGDDVTVSICFDSRSARKDAEGGEEYKANRKGTLEDVDFRNISEIKDIMEECGYNVYKMEGYEADDIVSCLTRRYKGTFDRTIIYTPDADMAALISDTVAINRYKQSMGYTLITKRNYSEYLSNELKCWLPYNSIMLFKATCGDTSDNIKGIKGFGPKAFEKYLSWIGQSIGQVDWEKMDDVGNLTELLENSRDYLGDSGYEQAKASLKLVAPMLICDTEMHEPVKENTHEKRAEAYGRYEMQSLVG